jgi:Fe-S cluster biogenesis protein NfuA
VRAPLREPEGVERIDELVWRIETGPEAGVRDVALELMQALLAFHGAGLERLLRIVQQGPGAHALVEALSRDALVQSLLLLHELHPVDVETRVREALAKSRPYLESHGGNVELVAIDQDGTVRLRMQGSCSGCPSSSVTLTTAIEDAIREAAPDVAAIIVVDDATRPAAPSDLVQLQTTRGNAGVPAAAGSS